MNTLCLICFKTDMSEKEYLRDSNYSTEPGLESDVLAEQAKINSADAIVFIYPVFWTEAPAKLVGWFDRVWSYGFAYGDKTMKVLDKAFDGMSKARDSRKTNWDKYLDIAYRKGFELFSFIPKLS